ncbi:MarR family winged helix-turn-helix transcriptional regulator [Spirochaeta cellobiosiphila]|uniref:MarR family winged helix-turn-helix transcriptional regulator n=1 Tax=Spirochaeta cellobiosiphila TaxID=504483 RepID=UPI000420500A|nr:MarR family transcriptional regulator [Spirochaeta cellobiosiphila]
MSDYPQLKLENQICFPLYAAHRLTTQKYQPLLSALDITYTQYLILMVLWERDDQTVSSIGKTLYLSSNTLTPLLKRLEAKGILTRRRSENDERQVLISLTEEGQALKEKAKDIPLQLVESFGDKFSAEKAIELKMALEELIASMTL